MRIEHFCPDTDKSGHDTHLVEDKNQIYTEKRLFYWQTLEMYHTYT